MAFYGHSGERPGRFALVEFATGKLLHYYEAAAARLGGFTMPQRIIAADGRQRTE